MTVVSTTTSSGQLDARHLDQLAVWISAATGVQCAGVHITRGSPTDAVDAYFTDPGVTQGQLDAAIASFVPDASTAVTAGSTYLIADVPLDPGQHKALDIHVHAALGDATSADPVFVDYYAVAWRNLAGGARVSQPVGSKAGQIPGFKVELVATATSAQVYVSTSKSGDLHIFQADVSVESEGQL